MASKLDVELTCLTLKFSVESLIANIRLADNGKMQDAALARAHEVIEQAAYPISLPAAPVPPPPPPPPPPPYPPQVG